MCPALPRGMRGCAGALPRTPPEAAFEKAPLDSPKAFGAGDCEAEWWRALTEAVCSHPHVRPRQGPLQHPAGVLPPVASPPCF